MTVKLTTFLIFILTALVDRADSQACSFCADGTDDVGRAQFVGSGTILTCPELRDEWTALNALNTDDSCKDLQLYAFQIGCCLSHPVLHCDVCPDGADFERENLVLQGNVQEQTCGQLELNPTELVGLYLPGVCEDTLLRRSAHYCGCPNVEQECFLCPNESDVGSPRREDKWISNRSCEGNQYLFSIFKAEECSPEEFNAGFDGVDLAGFCLCPDSPPREIMCELCPGGAVENPTFEYDESNTDATCGQLEQFAMFITRTDTCESVLAPAKEGCKCPNSGSADKSFVASLVLAGAMAIPAIL